MKLESSLRKVATALYCFLDTPKALACEIAMRYEEYGELAAMAASPNHYLEGPWGAEKYRRDAQACDLLRKSPLLPIKGNDRKRNAEEAFEDSESQCFGTNKVLRDLYCSPGVGEEPYQERLRHILCRAEKIAARILGPLPTALNGRFGPGTSFELKGQAFSTFADKLWITPLASPAALALFEHEFWPTLWGRVRLEQGLPLPGVIPGNRFTTVPKDAIKDRGICVEPLGNLWAQLGVGGFMKRRLANVGIKVDRSYKPDDPLLALTKLREPDGQTLHRLMARKGSMDDGIATIDLSNASDTVAFWLVRWVIPSDWFELLSSLRSPRTLFRKEWRRLEKFSSMGNGFTFELETLIFVSIIAACCDLKVGEELFCYGDDIILPKQHSREAMAILQACGFTPNMKKSFVEGPFRESCGGDYFSGYDVRSCFADGTFGSPLEWVALHNNLRQRYPRATLALKRCVDAIPTRLQLWGPPHLGDVVLHETPAKGWGRARTWMCKEHTGVRWLATIKAQPLRIPIDRWGEEFIIPLMLLGAKSSGIVPRDAIQGYCITKTSVS